MHWRHINRVIYDYIGLSPCFVRAVCVIFVVSPELRTLLEWNWSEKNNWTNQRTVLSHVIKSQGAFSPNFIELPVRILFILSKEFGELYLFKMYSTNSKYIFLDKLCVYDEYSAYISVSLYHVCCFYGDRPLLDWVFFKTFQFFGDRPIFFYIYQNLLNKEQK